LFVCSDFDQTDFDQNRPMYNPNRVTKNFPSFHSLSPLTNIRFCFLPLHLYFGCYLPQSKFICEIPFSFIREQHLVWNCFIVTYIEWKSWRKQQLPRERDCWYWKLRPLDRSTSLHWESDITVFLVLECRWYIIFVYVICFTFMSRVWLVLVTL
jgi:hypothetical protein